MSQNFSADDPAILYVDDEAQALKYFARSFGDDFRVLTAENADDAERLVNSGTEHIGIVISDQRMPGRTGASLLSALRVNHPQIVRLITTAFSDLESAIESVNSGEVLRYIVKPWDIDALKLDLHTAMRIYQLQKEREELLAEKLSVQQSITAVDRLRTLIVACSGFKAYPHAVWSACRYGEDIGRLAQMGTNPTQQRLDLWEQAEAETLHMRDIISNLAALPPAPAPTDAGTNVMDAWTDAIGKLKSAGSKVDAPAPTLPQSAVAKIPRSWLADIFANGLEGMAGLASNLEVSAQNNGDGKTTFVISGERQADATLPVLFSQTGDSPDRGAAALLKSYLMAGETHSAINLSGDAGKVHLTIELGDQTCIGDDRNGLQKIKHSFRSFEIWPQ
ncbi:MAG: response regulator [Filomicrobium sp.]